MISAKYTHNFRATIVIPWFLFLNHDLGRKSFFIRRKTKKLDKAGTDDSLYDGLISIENYFSVCYRANRSISLIGCVFSSL